MLDKIIGFLPQILFVLFLFNSKRILAMLNISKLRIRPVFWHDVSRDEFPEYIRVLFQAKEEALQSLGFVFLAAQRSASNNVVDIRENVFSALYWHPESAVLARIQEASLLSGQVIAVNFFTAFDNDYGLLTTNRLKWEEFPNVEQRITQDGYFDNLSDQFNFHIEAIRKLESEKSYVALHDVSCVCMIDAKNIQDDFEFFVKKSYLYYEAKTQSYGVVLKWAWQYLNQLSHVSSDIKLALAKPYKHEPELDSRYIHHVEMNTIGRQIALAAVPLSAWIKASILLVSFIVASLSWWQGNISALIALLIVLFVHELGHFLAMRMFNYSNLSIFFLPFFGAAASGHKPQAPVWQESIVLLAGPVVGLLAALSACFISSTAVSGVALESLRQFVFLGIVVNLFNLLPVGILDGGKLFDLVILSRFPYARVVFFAIGAASGLLFAYWSESLVLGFVMLILLLNLSTQFKAAAIMAAIAKESQSIKNPLQALDVIGQKLYAMPNLLLLKRIEITKIVYPMVLRKKSTWYVSFFLILFYVACLVFPLVGAGYYYAKKSNPLPLFKSTPIEQQQQAKEAEKEIAQNNAMFKQNYMVITDPIEKWQALDEAIDEGSMSDEAWLTEQRQQLIAVLPKDHAGVLSYQLEQASADNYIAQAQVTLNQLTTNGQRGIKALNSEQLALLCDTHSQLVMQKNITPVLLEQERMALNNVWAQLASANSQSGACALSITESLARIASYRQQTDEALLWIARYDHIDGHDPLTRGWFLLDIGQPEQALVLAKQHLAQDQAEDSNIAWFSLAGWAKMALQQPQQADYYFQQALVKNKQRTLDMLSRQHREMPLFLRFLLPNTDEKFKSRIWFGVYTLDHWAALTAFDTQAANQLEQQLRQQKIQSGFAGAEAQAWGKIRWQTYKVLEAKLALH